MCYDVLLGSQVGVWTYAIYVTYDLMRINGGTVWIYKTMAER